MMLRVAILGATGRMGQALLRLAAAADDLQTGGAATEPGHAAIGRDAHEVVGLPAIGVALTDDPSRAVAGCDVAVDFTLAAAAPGNAAACAAGGVPLVMGTTGLTPDGETALKAAGERVPVLYARNMSLGVNLLTELVRVAARTLGAEYDVEIIEAHHRHKVDAPSGTALQLGEVVAAARGARLEELAVYARHGHTGPRPAGAIGFASLRAGGLAGDHRVVLAGDDEVVELGHHALNRDVFAHGALRAARWVVGQSPGLYSMREMLGLDR
jgi:4-hydroxy-tetrahydrodipicolinate reductase